MCCCGGEDLRKNSVRQIYVVLVKSKALLFFLMFLRVFFLVKLFYFPNSIHILLATRYISCAYLDFTDSVVLTVLVFQINVFEIFEHCKSFYINILNLVFQNPLNSKNAK